MSYVTYFDEVKSDRIQGRNQYFVGGITIPMSCIAATETKLSDIATELFGSDELTAETEFHSSLIYRGRGPFKGKSTQERLDILEKLAAILAESTDIRRVYAAIDTTKLYNPNQAPEFAFAHF